MSTQSISASPSTGADPSYDASRSDTSTDTDEATDSTNSDEPAENGKKRQKRSRKPSKKRKKSNRSHAESKKRKKQSPTEEKDKESHSAKGKDEESQSKKRKVEEVQAPTSTAVEDDKPLFEVDDQGNPVLPRKHGYRIGITNGPFNYEGLKGKIQWKTTKERIHKAMVRYNYYGRADEITDADCMNHLYTVFECEDLEEDDEVQKHINAMFRNKLFTKVHNDGRVWRKDGFLKLDDPEKGTWRWIGGENAPPYLQATVVEKAATKPDDGTLALKEALRNYSGPTETALKLLVQEHCIDERPWSAKSVAAESGGIIGNGDGGITGNRVRSGERTESQKPTGDGDKDADDNADKNGDNDQNGNDGKNGDHHNNEAEKVPGRT